MIISSCMRQMQQSGDTDDINMIKSIAKTDEVRQNSTRRCVRDADQCGRTWATGRIPAENCCTIAEAIKLRGADMSYISLRIRVVLSGRLQKRSEHLRRNPSFKIIHKKVFLKD